EMFWRTKGFGSDLAGERCRRRVGRPAAAPPPPPPRLTELTVLELAARESAGDIEGALRLARYRAGAAPLDESAQLTLMRLLAFAGHQNEALESFAVFRTRLAEQLGADPGPALVELNTAILRGEAVGHNGTAAAAPGPPVDAAARDIDVPEFALPAAIGLRAAPNALLGRAEDLSALAALLPVSRVITVLGPGGAGKTRIANEVGARAAATNRVVLVELASVRAEGADARVEIEAAISATLGLSDVGYNTTTLRPRIDARQRLREAVAARPMLLILDNCEHLIEAVAIVVADLIGVADRLTVLTTSRAPLMITAETVYPLQPLAIDPTGTPAREIFAGPGVA
ncbi:BTAD domain-containing putative transcriptional regulator, partial [Nocardia brasiliensis]|uniref:BTAD domain-containing putative transcriptional regulator n=1 Tax=Nocardia brasiliensis TaxID=37326 RepID=UPI0024554DC0